MTDRQSSALSNPITDPNDLATLGKFARTLTRGERKFGTILTVDREKKEFWWHVSVSLLDSSLKPVLIAQITAADKFAVERLARELLNDVGRPDSEEIRSDENRCTSFDGLR